MRVTISFLVALVALGGGLWGLSMFYDSDFVHEGSFYPEPEPANPPIPVNTHPLGLRPLGNISCAEAEKEIFAAAAMLTSCSDASECTVVWVGNLDHIRVINKSNQDKFNELADQHVIYCGRIQYGSALGEYDDEVEGEITCSNNMCGVKYTVIETWEERLYRETIEAIEDDNASEAL